MSEKEREDIWLYKNTTLSEHFQNPIEKA